MRRLTALGTGTGVGQGPTTRKPGSGPKPPKNRVTLSPSLRAEVARMHARQVFLEYVAPLYPTISLDTLAAVLTASRVPAPRTSRGWTEKRTHDLLHRAQRAFQSDKG